MLSLRGRARVLALRGAIPIALAAMLGIIGTVVGLSKAPSPEDVLNKVYLRPSDYLFKPDGFKDAIDRADYDRVVEVLSSQYMRDVKEISYIMPLVALVARSKGELTAEQEEDTMKYSLHARQFVIPYRSYIRWPGFFRPAYVTAAGVYAHEIFAHGKPVSFEAVEFYEKAQKPDRTQLVSKLMKAVALLLLAAGLWMWFKAVSTVCREKWASFQSLR